MHVHVHMQKLILLDYSVYTCTVSTINLYQMQRGTIIKKQLYKHGKNIAIKFDIARSFDITFIHALTIVIASCITRKDNGDCPRPLPRKSAFSNSCL